MSRRLLALCVRAYPPGRETEGEVLLALAMDLAGASRCGVLRQAWSLVCGGAAERLRGRRGRRAWVAAGAAVASTSVMLGAGLGSVQARSEVELYSCGHDRTADSCTAVADRVAGLRQADWTCDRLASSGEVSWRCTRW